MNDRKVYRAKEIRSRIGAVLEAALTGPLKGLRGELGMPAHTGDPAVAGDQQAEAIDFARAFTALTREQRNIIADRYVMGIPLVEIAGQRGIDIEEAVDVEREAVASIVRAMNDMREHMTCRCGRQLCGVCRRFDTLKETM